MRYIRKLFRWLKYNKRKKMYLEALFYAAIYRFLILIFSSTFLEKRMGVRGEESEREIAKEAVNKGREIGYVVNWVCKRTPWESKCLVRALTAQRMLRKRRISSTLYLGCGKMDGKLVAHAWIRSGSQFLTGGNGDEYTMVAKFCRAE